MKNHLQPGTLLQNGKYKIVRFIKSGGFGCTYEAENTYFEERVAIKEFFVRDFCNRDFTTALITVGTESKKSLVGRLKQKFLEEAKALYKLRHQGIVHVSDVFEENGTAYYVMDYIDGYSLDIYVKENGPLSEDVVLDYIRQVCDALKYVHSQNRLHLDLKPGNIMLTKNGGKVILIDFGTAKQYDECSGENTSTLLGSTPGYAPLEQTNTKITQFFPATDIYALGATMYKLLTGITPLTANERGSGEEMEPLPKTVSSATRNAIEYAMQLPKMKRPQTVDEFLLLLDAPVQQDDDETIISFDDDATVVQNAEENTAQEDNKTKKSHRWLWWLLVAVILILGLFALKDDKENGESQEDGSGLQYEVMELVSCDPVDETQVVNEEIVFKDLLSANCHIVSASGAYKFKAVKGESPKSVGAVNSVSVLWESFGTATAPHVGDLIKSVDYKDGWICFETADKFKEGNAVIAAKDAKGTILWSWHIWLTDQPQGQEYYNNAGTMMDRNLGATSATPGDVGALGLLYQWGRKDPFLGSSSISKAIVAESTITWPSPVASNSIKAHIVYATSHPTTFITGNTENLDWIYTGSSSIDTARWTESSHVKSLYDPCPAGWRVPDGGDDSVWSKASGSSLQRDFVKDGSNSGMNFRDTFSKDSIVWYPSAGGRQIFDGELAVNGSGGYWSASSHNITFARGLLFSPDVYIGVNPSVWMYPAEGLSVRCIQE